MNYITMAILAAEVPPQFITQALDDDSDGVADSGLFDQLVANAAAEIDGMLGQRYAVPFEAPVPPLVIDACTKFVAEKLYTRRGLEGDRNPFTKRAAEVRALLRAIGEGKSPLATEASARSSAVAITEPANTTSGFGRIAI